MNLPIFELYTRLKILKTGRRLQARIQSDQFSL